MNVRYVFVFFLYAFNAHNPSNDNYSLELSIIGFCHGTVQVETAADYTR